METIHILLLRPGAQDYWLNRMTAAIGGAVHGNQGYCHAELCVPHPRGGYISSSIFNGETVTMNHTKTFANPNYVVFSLSISRNQLQTILKHIETTHTARVGFDSYGMYLAALPVHLSLTGASPSRTFCSRYVVETLQAAGVEVVKGLNASITSPSKLFRVLQSNQDGVVTGTVKYKEMQMMNTGSDRAHATTAYVPSGGSGWKNSHKYMRLTSL